MTKVINTEYIYICKRMCYSTKDKILDLQGNHPNFTFSFNI